MKRSYLGIDPGVSGGMAIISHVPDKTGTRTAPSVEVLFAFAKKTERDIWDFFTASSAKFAIEKAVILCEGNVIRPKDILVKQSWKPQTASVVPNLEEVERQAIETAILQNNGNLTAAAEQLGISRQTLYNKLKRFKP